MEVISENDCELLILPTECNSSVVQSYCDKIQKVLAENCVDHGIGLPKSLLEAIRFVTAAFCVTSASSQTCLVGKAWVSLAIGFLTMYIPNLPLDPAAESRVRHEYECWTVENAISDRDAHLHVARAFVGGDTNYRLLSLNDDILAAQRLVSKDVAMRPLRPTTSRLEQLQAEFNHCLSAIHPAGTITALLHLSSEHDQAFTPQCVAFLRTWQQFEKRVQAYDDYQDIIQPILEAMTQIRIGLSMLISEVSIIGDEIVDGDTKKTPNMMDISALLNIATSDVDLSDYFRLNERRARIQALRALTLRQNMSASHTSDIHLVKLVCDQMFQQWFIKREEVEQQLLHDSSLYKYAAPEETSADDYRELFPDYEESASAGSRDTQDSQLIEEETIRLHGDVIDEIVSPSVISGSMRYNSALLVHLQQSLRSAHEDSLQTTGTSASNLAGCLYLADHELRQLEQDQSTVRHYDFYRSPNIYEVKQILPVIHSLVFRVSAIAEVWPENSVLLEILEALQRILDLSIMVSIAQVLTMLEQAFGLLAQWQEVASKEFSLTELFEAVRSQIVAWRRYELKCWPQLFALEESAASKADLKIWYNLYEVLVFVPTQKTATITYNDLHDTIQSLIQYLRSASIAQFRQRLEFLKSMQQHIRLLDANEASRNLWHAACMLEQYFSSFLPQIDKALTQERKVLSKEVTDVIRLASWRDTNVYALRESARRSHRILYKIVHKYRRVLNRPAQELLNVGLMDFNATRHIVNDIPRKSYDLAKAYPIIQADQSLNVFRPARYTEPRRTALRMEKIVDCGPLSVPGNPLGIFVSEVVDQIKQLRAETPQAYNKDEIKLVNHLKNRKYKLLSDSFKTLKSFGLRSVIRPDDLQRQSSIEAIFLTNESDIYSLIPGDINSYFVRIVDILSAVRSGYANHSTDLTASDIKRATGYFDSMLLHLLKERHELLKFSSGFLELQELMLQFNAVTLIQNEEPPSIDFSHESRYSQRLLPAVIAKLNAIKELMNVTTEQHAVYRRHNHTTTVIDLEEQQWWKQLCISIEDLLNTVRSLSSSIVPKKSTRRALSDYEKCLVSMKQEIMQEQHRNISSSFLFESLLGFVNGVMDSRYADGIPITDPGDMTGIELDLQALCDQILLAGQKIQAVNKSAPSEDEEDAWFSKASQARTKHLRAASVDTVVSLLKNFLSKLQQIETIEESRLEHVCTMYAPILQAYFQVCSRIKVDFERFHSTTSKCTLLIGQNLDRLAKEGFCSPQSTEPDEKDNKATSDGTGLGEGGGAKDITKDLEDDEDLGDLEGIEDAEEKDDGEQENNDAKEMEDDVGGDLEDVDGQSVSNDEEEDESGDDEIEDEVGEVDDQNDTALDEKMWNDEEENDNSRNKDTKNDADNQDEQQGDIDLVDKDQANDKNEAEREDHETKKEAEQDKDQAEENDDENETDQEIGPENETEEQEEPLHNMDNLDLPEDLQIDDENMSDDNNLEEAASDTQENLSDKGETEDENEALESMEDLDEHEEDRGDPEENDETVEPNLEKEKDEEMPESAEDDADIVPGDEPEIDTLEASKDEDDIGGEGPEHGGTEIRKGEVQDEYDQRDPKDGNDEHSDNDEIDIEMKDKPDGGEGGANKSQNMDANADPKKNEGEELRSLGDALKQFRRILNIEESTQPEDVEESTKDSETAPDTKNTDQFEHVGEEQSADTQAMGPSTEEASAGINHDEDEVMPELEDNRQEDDDTNQLDSKIESEVATNVDEKGLVAGEEGLMDESLDSLRRRKQAAIDEVVDENLVEASQFIPEIPMMQEQQVTTDSIKLWQKHEQDTRDLANSLSEQLRLILEPTLATKMRGDFRTGKRLNMRRIIPYIASQFKKDKIWMRRSKPSKRQYQVMIAIDDSKSMAESSSIQLAFDTVALVATALSVLEVGQIAVTKFGQRPEVVHAFQDQFSSESGAKIFESFTFDQTKTDIRALLEQSLSLFTDARALQHNSGAELWQLQFIISDGICEDHESIKRLLRQAQEARIMVVFVVIDTIQGSKKHSILQMSQVKYVTGPDGSKKLQVQQYMEEFAFQNYLIIQNVAELPEMLSSTLRQFFAASQ